MWYKDYKHSDFLKKEVVMRINRKEIFTIILFVVFMFVTLILPCVTLATPIPDTGQIKCYDDVGNEITPCPQPGEPFYGQDGNYSINPQWYTKLDANGNELLETATEWAMVRDNVTGLIWENKTDDGTIHDKDNYYDWYDAQDVFIATLNSQNFGGYSDWRLPTVKELSFLIDRNRYIPSINTTYFSDTVSSYYWSSTTNAHILLLAWIVGFYGGSMYSGSDDYHGYVRAVRAGQGGPLCPTESIYGEHSEQTELLRYIRDNVLSTTKEGRELIKLYYEWSPVIVKVMEEDEEFKEVVKEMIDGALAIVTRE